MMYEVKCSGFSQKLIYAYANEVISDDMLLNYLILVLSYAMHDITDSQCDIMLS